MATNGAHENGVTGVNGEKATKILLDRLGHVRYAHPDITRAHRFLLDFGLEPVHQTGSRTYYKGFGDLPYIYVAEQAAGPKRKFLGGAWVVASRAELEKATKLPNASGIEELDGPGGGSVVTLPDPKGHNVLLIYGQETASGEESPPEIVQNTARGKPRKGEFHRFKHGPSPVHKLGHYGFVINKDDFAKTIEWYQTTFNLATTDAVYDPQTKVDETTFLHIDKGLEYSDHHSLFMAAGSNDEPSHIHHSSFEVHDMDTQLLGHDWLRKGGWTNAWGVGRHVLGSQIFDYWFDASGNIIEHYSDGDLVNRDTPVSREPASPNSLFVWGPNIPLAFLTGRIEDVGLLAPPQVNGDGDVEKMAARVETTSIRGEEEEAVI